MVTAIIIVGWICISWLIYLVIRKKENTLSLPFIFLCFGCKIMAGLAYGYIFKRFYNGDDTWGLNHDAMLQYERLLQKPGLFFSDIFHDTPVQGTNELIFQPVSYIENLEYAIITKTIALFNIVSQGNYYINVVFFNIFSFFGLWMFYRFIAVRVDADKKRIVALIIFLFPPALFWLSGIRAEGFLILFTGLAFYYFIKWIEGHRLSSLLTCFFSMAMLFIFRNGVVLMMVAPMAGWWTAVHWKLHPKKAFALVCGTCIAIITFTSLFLPEKYNLLGSIAHRQQEFMMLKGNTRFNLSVLAPNAVSFIRVLPEAVLNTFIRPFLWEAKGLLQLFAAVENMTVIIFLIIVLYRTKKRVAFLLADPIIWTLLLACIFNYILIGYIVPFPGAIVRYKIIPEFFLMSGFMLMLWAPRYQTPVQSPHSGKYK